jgi:hypothetical protein
MSPCKILPEVYFQLIIVLDLINYPDCQSFADCLAFVDRNNNAFCVVSKNRMASRLSDFIISVLFCKRYKVAKSDIAVPTH